MFIIKVQYYFTELGKQYFELWWKKLEQITSQQDGFISINLSENYNIKLVFKNEKKFDDWCDTEIHQSLVDEIEPYYEIEPLVEVEIILN